MKCEIIKLIRIFGIGLNEIYININLSFSTINSLEFVEPNKILIHKFVNDIDYEIDYDTLEDMDKKLIFKILSLLIYN